MTTTSANPSQLLDSKQAAELLGISGRMLWQLSAPRGPIPVCRFDTRLRFKLADLEEFIRQSTVTSSASN